MNNDITAAAITAAKPGSVLVDYRHPGLRLKVGKTGAAWSYRFRTPAGLRQLHIGKYPATSIERAWAKWDEAREARANGVDLAGKRDARKKAEHEAAEREHAAAYSVADIANWFLHEHLTTARNEKSVSEVRRLFGSYLDGAFGKRSAVAVDRADAAGFLRGVKAPSAARQLRQELRAAWNKALDHRRLPPTLGNPWTDVLRGDKRLQAKPKTRVLSQAELALLLKWLPEAPKLSQANRDILILTLRLGVRSGEACSVAWRHVDLKRGIWTLPAEATKVGVGRAIILPKQALKIFKRRHDERGDDTYVFESPITRDGEPQPVQQASVVWALSYAREHLPKGLHADWSAHDLRRTARTQWAIMREPEDVSEAALGHVQPGIKGTYNLHQYDEQVGELLARWNARLDKLQ